MFDPSRRRPTNHPLLRGPEQLEDRAVPSSSPLSPTTPDADPVAEVTAGPRLASVDTNQSAVLNGVLTSLAGPGAGLSLSAVDYNALANGNLNLGRLLDGLAISTGAGTPSQALTANATLGQILSAAASAAQADGDTALVTALNHALAGVGPLAGTIRLGDLLQVDLPPGSLAHADVNALDLLVGSVQLFNYRNVATTTAPVTLSGAALGLAGVLNEVQLQAQVVEPPVTVVGTSGTQFYSAEVRLKLDVDLVDLPLDTAALLPTIQGVLPPAATVSATATLGQLQLYADVARGAGAIQAIDVFTSAVTLRATPGLADVYLGTVPDAVFFDRGKGINPATDLTPGTVGSLNVSATLLGTPLLNVPLGITLKSFAQGAAPLQSTVTFLPPFPKSATVGSSAAAVGNLVTSLVANAQVGLTGTPGLLSPVIGTLAPLTGGALTAAAQPVLSDLLAGVADPALHDLGIGIGEMDLTVSAAVIPAPAVAAPDVVITLSGRPVTAYVLANDNIPADLTRAMSISAGPADGTAVMNADGSVTYTSATGFLGTDVFTYTLTDRFGRTTSALVTVLVGVAPGPNGAPQANPDVAVTGPGAAVTVPVLANDTDPDGDPLTVIGTSRPAHGSVVVNADGSVTYTPAAGFQGVDTFAYAAGDGRGGVGAATVTITVGTGGGTDRDPTAAPDTAGTPEGSAVTVNVLANDSDPDGDPLRIVGLGQPGSGTVVLNADGTVTYAPAADFFGTDRFTYTVDDGRGGVAGATVTVTVARHNTAPSVNPDTATTPVGTPVLVPVLANDTDADGDRLTVVALSGPANGTATVAADGIVTYTPAAGFRGTDTFTYTASDGFGGTGTATVTVTVGSGNHGGPGEGTNHDPVANGDTATTVQGLPVTVNVLANDTDADGDALTVAGVTAPAHGAVTVNADGTLTYTPAAGFVGTDTFAYTAADGHGGAGAAPVQIVVAAPPGTVPNKGPAIPELKQYAVGADTSGGPRVTVYNPDGSVRFDFFAYDPSTRFGANVVLADVNGDGVADVITSPGFGGAPHIRIFDGKDLHLINEFMAFDQNFRGGCTVAAGDFNGDGVVDLAVAAGQGGGPRVFVIDGRKFDDIVNAEVAPSARIADFFAFDPKFGGGVSVAATDLDGDGVAELVTGAGPGGPPLARVWDVRSGAMLSEFLAFDESVTQGVNVGGHGDLIVFGAGRGAPPEVRVYQGTAHTLVSSGLMYEPAFTGGVRVAFGDTVDPTKPLFLVGAGVGGGPRIKVLRPNLDVVLPDYFAFEDTFRGGVYVA